MKKEPGVNGDWIPVSLHERISNAVIPSLVALGTPAAVQTQYAFNIEDKPLDWVLPLVIWVYGLLFWIVSTGTQLIRSKHWKWTDEAIEEQQRYWSDARIASRKFWGHWWVRFPIGLLFLSLGVHALLSKDFTAEWISLILLMFAFLTPFVFVAEMVMLPLMIVLVIAYLALVTLVPMSVIIMLTVLAMFAIMLMVMSQRSKLPVKRTPPEPKAEDTPAAEALAETPAVEEPAADTAPAATEVEALAAPTDQAPAEQTGDAVTPATPATPAK